MVSGGDAGAVGAAATPTARPTTLPAVVTKPGAAGELLNQRFTKEIKPLMAKHCFECHGNGKHKGDMTLDKFSDWKSVQADKPVWQTVVDVLQQGLMPPEEKPQPSQKEKDLIVAWAGEAMEYIDCSGRLIRGT